MKKLLEKDKKLRIKLKEIEKQKIVLKAIFKNFNYFSLIRWNALLKFENLSNKTSYVILSPRCLETVNRKRFNKLTNFSRHTFLKSIRFGKISNFKKSSW